MPEPAGAPLTVRRRTPRSVREHPSSGPIRVLPGARVPAILPGSAAKAGQPGRRRPAQPALTMSARASAATRRWVDMLSPGRP
jgi:hypothetical protein